MLVGLSRLLAVPGRFSSSSFSVHWRCRIIDLVAHYEMHKFRCISMEARLLTVICVPFAANHLECCQYHN